jgi:N-methylhydantoinase A/oxoprolinase/acetone carboxylase beta subunit
VGVDIGGTFTDFVIHNARTGAVHTHKLLTTPADPSEAVFAGIETLARQHDFRPAGIAVVLHATTLATNTLIEGNGAKVALVTTQGFRDILEMRRETRFDDYDLTITFPPPLVPRRLRLEVPERVLADGSVRVPLDKQAARRVIGLLRQAGIEAVAVCFVHSWANPEHELLMGGLFSELAPELPISMSCRVQPEIREYERMNTTTANAYVQPRVREYLGQLREGFNSRGYLCPFYVMQSNGGFAGPAESSTFPVRLIESGPAAGVIAAAVYGKHGRVANLLSFDMGGTTAKIAVLTNGEPRMTTELEVARTHRFKRGSGYPIKCPSIELSEIGAGGGSIATVNALGLIRVGPESAGSVPGPACYDRGGRRPTVTDADVILGYLDPDFFAGGTFRLDRAAAEAAVEADVARPSGISVVDAAWGIHEIVNENMATAARLHVLERGEDPRTFVLFAFGGAGPVHAHRLARKLGVGRVIYPLGAGVTSAYGLMTAPMSTDLVRSYVSLLSDANWATIDALFVDMEQEARQKIMEESPNFSRLADMRYSGQGYEIQVLIPYGPYGPASAPAFDEAFADTYERIFGRRVTNVPVQLVNLRLFARGQPPQAPAGVIPGKQTARDSRRGERLVYFGREKGFLRCPVYRRYALGPGEIIDGPAILEENETTVVMEPGALGRIDDRLNFVVAINGAFEEKQGDR